MDIVSLEDLILTPEELEIARSQVQEIAYLKWEAAGCPVGLDEEFWSVAELEWIEYFYVPDRYLCDSRPDESTSASREMSKFSAKIESS